MSVDPTSQDEKELETETAADNPTDDKKEKAPDLVARGLSVIAILLTGINLYYTQWRPPIIGVGIGQTAFVTARPRVGLLCIFTNDGATQTVITSATLQWKESPLSFQWVENSPSLEQKELDENGNQKTVVETRYTRAVPFAVKAKDQTTMILWFSANDKNFKFDSGIHPCTLIAYSPSGKVVEANFDVEIKEEYVPFIDDKSEQPVNVLNQR